MENSNNKEQSNNDIKVADDVETESDSEEKSGNKETLHKLTMVPFKEHKHGAAHIYIDIYTYIYTHKIYLPMDLGFVAFEKQARTGLSGCLPEQFGIQFLKVMKADDRQTDPLEFSFYFNTYRSMESEQKVRT